MNRLLLLVALLCASRLVAAPSSGPLRVLYLGQEGPPTTRHCAALMQELGRDAIWFDYASDPAQITPEWLGHFDAVFLDAPKGTFKALTGAGVPPVISAEFAGAERE